MPQDEVSHTVSCNRRRNALAGQSLIETIVAIGLLTIGIIGGLTLAIYSLGTSETTLSQITATGLAREGIEIIRSARDSQWRSSALRDCSSQICEGIRCPSGSQMCYPDWLDSFRGLPAASSGQSRDYYLEFNPGTGAWQITDIGESQPDRFQLFYGVNGTYVDAGHAVGGATRFYRRITLKTESPSGFSNQNPRLSVLSTVYWTGKNCPLDTADIGRMKCNVAVQEYLTNWKNY